jgi:hypothetical protein
MLHRDLLLKITLRFYFYTESIVNECFKINLITIANNKSILILKMNNSPHHVRIGIDSIILSNWAFFHVTDTYIPNKMRTPSCLSAFSLALIVVNKHFKGLFKDCWI